MPLRKMRSARSGVLHHAIANLQGEIANRHEIIVCLRGEADHVIELQVFDAARKNQIGAVEDFIVRHRLVDHAT